VKELKTVSAIREQFAGVAVLVVGDAMLDRHLLGKVTRISPEAPVPVVRLEGERCSPGGAANVAASVAALGCRVTFASIVGTDPTGALLQTRLTEMGVSALALADGPGVRTVCKTRVVAGGYHQLLRLDDDGSLEAFERSADRLRELVLPLIRHQDAVVLADYDKGTLTRDLLQAVIKECRRAGVPCIVDPKKSSFEPYAGATILAPNVFEASRALGRPLEQDESICQAAEELQRNLALDNMLITRGPDGMTLQSPEGIHHFPAAVREVADVTGAGDTVVAVLAACLAANWKVTDACRLATHAAGIAVSKAGTYVVKLAELEAVANGASPKVVDRQAGHRLVAEWQRLGRRVVFTNGCFDILHAGHLYCLEEARKLGDVLVVGLNSDVSVRLNKGPNRPINNEDRRARLLAGLECVDLVILFDERTPEELIQTLAPDVLVKGGDYDPATMAGAAFVRRKGGQVLTIPLLDGLSTTRLLEAGVTHEYA
jgi:D-beta-D-heptose 7-phosphate kinase/D-beta-D-heptose 1-phosphate adenosyltransferase